MATKAEIQVCLISLYPNYDINNQHLNITASNYGPGDSKWVHSLKYNYS